ncbi:restriction endonuclease subunit S [Treponema sp. OMZ 857]|uniref:restriction endonuclease subunit S n=1 Tax=Treponema sp. OMZ 857 TaxID=1643513 RepID=UPI0020A46776|nr:restriction endonuclease subunit S [Treponema sp. OMZ 857]UTC43347.1 restriction endonuclease subunit S [Treponema sp. OMZ 857]
MKDIEDDIPFAVPEGWAWCRLGEVCEFKGGKRIPAGLSTIKEKTSHIYIRVTDMKNNSISDEDLVYITDEIYEKIQRYTISKNDLYLTIAGSIGRVGIVPDKFDGMNLTENALKLTDISVDKKYLMLILNSPFVQDYFESTYHQVAMPKLSLVNASKTAIPLPPIAEQKRIVTAIEAIFAQIDLLEQNKADLQTAVKQAKSKILDLAIHGKLVPQDPVDEPASVMLERLRTEKEARIAAGEIKRGKNDSYIYRNPTDNCYYQKYTDGCEENISDEIPFDVPDGWAWCRLGETADIARGGSPRPIEDFITDKENGINWIKIGDTALESKYIISAKEKIKLEGKKYSRFVHAGDFLLTNSMSFGRPYILKIDGCIHDGWLVFADIRKYLLKDFLYYTLNSQYIYNSFSLVAAGSTVKNLKADTVKQVLFPLPPLAEQKRIVAKIEELFAKLDFITTTLAE